MALAFASRARSRAPRITRPARVMTNTNATTLCSFRVLSFLFVAFLCTPPVRAQFGPFEGSDATCSIDISTVRVDPTLGERCDPRTQGDGLCDSCICDLSDRLLEAGYQVRGATSIPFESCAFTHLSTLQRKGGVTLMGMMQVASQCGDIPDCIDGLERIQSHGRNRDAGRRGRRRSRVKRPDQLRRPDRRRRGPPRGRS
jgi:hypothetical protein